MVTAEREDPGTVSVQSCPLAVLIIDARSSKTLVYETALRQNRVGDVMADISRSLNTCASNLSVLANEPVDVSPRDTKQIEMSIAKLRILLNDIELISFDIDQLKQSDFEDKAAIDSINRQWEDLLQQATDKHQHFEKKLEQLKMRQRTLEYLHRELDTVDKQVLESSINTKFPLLVERLELIEEKINEEFSDDNDPTVDDLRSRTDRRSLVAVVHSRLSSFRTSARCQTAHVDQGTRTDRTGPFHRTVPFVVAKVHRMVDRHGTLLEQSEERSASFRPTANAAQANRRAQGVANPVANLQGTSDHLG